MRGKNSRVIVGVLIVVGALVYFGAAGFQEGKAYYKTIEELDAMGERAYNERIRVGGRVAEGSIKRADGTLTFQLEQNAMKLPVVYTGSSPVPDTFRDGAQALCDGEYRRDGTFEARQIQAKCASKYEMEYGTADPES